MNCKNCSEEVQGNYCENCGQRTSVDKITFTHILNEISENILQIDRGFFYTMKAMWIHPGKSIREYLDGRRRKYFKPLAFVLTMSTIYFLMTQWTGQNTWIDDLITGWTNGISDSQDPDDVPPILIWFANNYAYATLILLPVFSLASYISFPKKDRNYFEHLTLNSYTTGQQAILYSIFVLIRIEVKNEIFEDIPILLSVIYAFWAFWQFFDQGNRVVNILRSFLTYILYFLFSLMILFLVMGIWKLLN